jgi:Icc-related predicted phosphoesterase
VPSIFIPHIKAKAYHKYKPPTPRPKMAANTKGSAKTRFLIISDTHDGFQGSSAGPYADARGSFRPPFPKADVLLHSGDLTMVGTMPQYRNTIAMLKGMDAELKLVIAGNHDLSLHGDYYRTDQMARNIQGEAAYDADTAREAHELWTGQEAKDAGITYLTEGLYTFELSNGAKFSVYASPWQPAFFDWAFNYPHEEDRWNPPHLVTGKMPQGKLHTGKNIVPAPPERDPHPIPEGAQVDIMITHGPAWKHLDKCMNGVEAGCPQLLRALDRVRPRLHCFGHIHEAWGCERVAWQTDKSKGNGEYGEATETIGTALVEGDSDVQTPFDAAVLERRAAYVDISSDSGRPLQYGEETLLVNSCIMSVKYNASYAGWLVDMDLPLK